MSLKVKRRSCLLWSRWSMASLSGYLAATASTQSKAKLNFSALGKVRLWRTPFSSSSAWMKSLTTYSSLERAMAMLWRMDRSSVFSPEMTTAQNTQGFPPTAIMPWGVEEL